MVGAAEKGEGPSSRVVILGAGAAGLAAARRLLLDGAGGAGGTTEVVLLEASPRPGGRLRAVGRLQGFTRDSPLTRLTDGWGYLPPLEVKAEKQLLVLEAGHEARQEPSCHIEDEPFASWFGSKGAEGLPEHPRALDRDSGAFVNKLAAEVEAAGAKMELSARVTWVKQQPDGRFLIVSSRSSAGDGAGGGAEGGGATWGVCADYVVVTASLGTLKSGSICFEPPLPEEHVAAIDRLGFGGADMVTLEFERCFWPEDAHCIKALSPVGTQSRAPLVFDVAPPASAAERPALRAILQQPLEALWPGKTDEEVVGLVLQTLQRGFGEGRVPPLVGSSVARWSSSAASVGGWPSRGADADHDRLAMPLCAGRLQFAGEATTRQRFATAHGAHSAGAQAASLILADLAQRASPVSSPGNGELQKKKRVSVLTLVYVRKLATREILLGLKKRGFGEGKLNGFGGKVEEGETPVQGAARELLEESGLEVSPDQLRFCGQLTYTYDSRPKLMQVHVFDICEGWRGEPVESEEMRPVWVKEDALPLADMWADDEHWLPQYLCGDLSVPFVGNFRFKGHEGEDSYVILNFDVKPAAAPGE